MSLNINNYNSLNNTYGLTSKNQGIDTNAVKDITSQILDKNIKTVDLDSVDLTKFNRAQLGLDLYNSRTNIEKATQVAVRNAGLDINLNQNFIANVQYLNAQAAQDSVKTAKQVEGKVVLPVSEATDANVKNVFAVPQAAQLFGAQNLNKDKRGSNPFSFYQPAANKEEKSEKEPLNIFA